MMTTATPTRPVSTLQPKLSESQRVVVVHSGARDAYQVATALAEAGILERLVTDLYWPADKGWAQRVAPHLPNGLTDLLMQRSAKMLPSSLVSTRSGIGMATLLASKLPRVSKSVRRRLTRLGDAVLGYTAGQMARETGSGLLSYSYYGHAAFSQYPGDGILFQLHPHPASMRRILTEELAAHPECAASLQQEWEMALPEQDFQRLVAETTMARHFLAASSFTRSTLIEHGARREAIRVIPYGVDSMRFMPDAARQQSAGSRLRLLFVGQINQRKGIKYLLQALGMLDTSQVEVTVCGRVVDDLRLFRPYADCVTIRPNVTAQELLAAYQSSDLFVFPSIAEGFGQVLLESLACGLPIVSTTHTAAPDLIEQGRQGFVVEPRRPDQLAAQIDWALSHRRELIAMRREARELAEQFTWARFRAGVVDAVQDALTGGHSSFPSLQLQGEEAVR